MADLLVGMVYQPPNSCTQLFIFFFQLILERKSLFNISCYIKDDCNRGLLKSFWKLVGTWKFELAKPIWVIASTTTLINRSHRVIILQSYHSSGIIHTNIRDNSLVINSFATIKPSNKSSRMIEIKRSVDPLNIITAAVTEVDWNP